MIYTFDSLKNEIKNKLSQLYDWGQTLYFGAYERIIDILAYTGSLLSYLAEFYYRESKWETAQKRSSLVTMAKLLGYTPYRKNGAQGYLLCSADNNFNDVYEYIGENVTIPRWTEFSDENNNVNVYTTQQYTYQTGYTGNLLLHVKEGIVKKYIYQAKGIINEKIYIYSDSIDNTEIEISIVDSNENLISYVNITNNLYLINDPSNYYCTIENSKDYDYIIITFGDDIHTKKLNQNDYIKVTYAETKGKDGNIYTLNYITKCNNILYDSKGNISNLYFKNIDAIIGGADIEDFDSIKNNAPNLFQTGMLLSSKENWKSLLNSIYYVNKSVVYAYEELGQTLQTNENNIVYVACVSNTGENLTNAQKNDVLQQYINPKKSLTDAVVFQPIEKIYLKFVINAKISNLPILIMQNNIRKKLYDTYNVFTVDFQKNIYQSNFYKIIDNVDNIIYHQSEVWYLEKDIDYLVTNQKIKVSYTEDETPIKENQNYIIPDTFEVWIKRKVNGEWQTPLQIGYDDNNIIIGMNGYTIQNGYITYATNIYSFTIQNIANDIDHSIYGIPNPSENDPLGYILYIAYQCKDGNNEQTQSIRLPYYYQITDIDTDFIFTDLIY